MKTKRWLFCIIDGGGVMNANDPCRGASLVYLIDTIAASINSKDDGGGGDGIALIQVTSRVVGPNVS